jgi:hypothetical protein
MWEENRQFVLQRETAMSAAGVSAWAIAAADASSESDQVPISQTVAAPTYSQATLTALSTPVRAVDINELRTMLANVCAYYGMAAPTWASGAVTAGTTSLAQWTNHVTELRACVDSVIARVNGWDSSNTTLDIPAVSWTAIGANCPRAAIIQQIRDAITTL